MAPPNRPIHTTPRTRRSPTVVMPSSLATSMAQALVVLQLAIQTLHTDLAIVIVQVIACLHRASLLQLPLRSVIQKCPLLPSSLGGTLWCAGCTLQMDPPRDRPPHQAQLCSCSSACRRCKIYQRSVVCPYSRCSSGCHQKISALFLKPGNAIV